MGAENTGEDEFDMKQSRLEHPTGWMMLTRYETIRFIIDALLEASPGHEFNKSELARRTGLSREAIREHIPFLVKLGVVNEVDGSAWAEYQLNNDARVTSELIQLNSAVNAVLSGQDREIEGTKYKFPEMDYRFVSAPNMNGAIVRNYRVSEYSEKSKVASGERIGMTGPDSGPFSGIEV